MNKKYLLLTLLLASCTWEHETHGHYKFDANKIEKSMSRQKIINILGPGLCVNTCDNVLYYMYAKNKTNILTTEIVEAKILRLEFDEDDYLIKKETLDYQTFVYDKNATKAPEMKVHIMDEIFSTIGKIGFGSDE